MSFLLLDITDVSGDHLAAGVPYPGGGPAQQHHHPVARTLEVEQGAEN